MTPILSTFRTNEPFLSEQLEQAHRGELQLPDFQRGWVWDDHRIRALIASISLSYSIGDRHHCLDMAACLDPEVDRTDAVVSVPADRVARTNFNGDIKLDLATREEAAE
jgi:hypothetical protein